MNDLTTEIVVDLISKVQTTELMLEGLIMALVVANTLPRETLHIVINALEAKRKSHQDPLGRPYETRLDRDLINEFRGMVDAATGGPAAPTAAELRAKFAVVLGGKESEVQGSDE
jgi:hypothetical protein